MNAELIDAFLHDFSYLNHQGKRNGWLMFGNRGLTRDLEHIAAALRSDLEALKNNNKLTDEQKCMALLQTVRGSFNKAEAARVNHGHACNARQHKPYRMVDVNGAESIVEYKKPYKPAKFERELIKGLMAINVVIADVTIKQLDPNRILLPINRECNELIMEIDGFRQPKVALATGRPVVSLKR